ncbi:MAG: prolyl oligopeptidase family serine peptidase [Clostridia bacterium]|nr:prolyl oligopeptidase family serine peptidase [Clostridia bacterium]
MADKLFYESDREFINADNVFCFCNTNIGLSGAAPRGIVLEFPGLGGGSCLGGSMELGQYSGDYAMALADNGLVLAYVFPGPWSWMNKGAVRISDMVVDALRDRCGLPPVFPLIATGGSMGGLGGLVFSADTRHRLAACAVTCPCIDARASMGADPAFPRTFLSAVAAYDIPFEAALASISPASRIPDMQDVPYLILADCDDEIFPLKDTDDYVNALRSSGKNVEYIHMEGCTHGGFTEKARNRFTEFIIEKAAEFDRR